MRTRQEASPSHLLQADVPLHDPSQDAFDRRPFADGVVRAIQATPPAEGFVIGIHGPWGDGKSTVLNFIAAGLKTAGIRWMPYNPWRFTDEARMLGGFFESLAAGIGPRRPDVRKLVAGLAGTIGALASVADERTAKLAGAVESRARRSLEEHREQLHRELRKLQLRYVVLIDDIDRLDKDELFTLFRMIKASADLPGVVYVLAFDDAAVADALQERYGGRDSRAGRRFLEKIVQMPLALPPADPAALEREVRAGLDHLLDEVEIRLSDSDRVRFDQIFTLGVRQGMHTPRQVKQYLNACRFALAALKGEANPADVLLVEALRVVYPAVHAGVRRSQEWFHGVPSHQGTGEKGKDVLASLLRSGLRQLPRLEREAVDRLLAGLFPRYGPEKLGIELTPGGLEQWRKDRRVCSPAYCGRYFSYAVARTDVSDATMESLRSEAERPDSRVLPSLVAEVLSPLRQDAGVERLEMLVRDVSPPAA